MTGNSPAPTRRRGVPYPLVVRPAHDEERSAVPNSRITPAEAFGGAAFLHRLSLVIFGPVRCRARTVRRRIPVTEDSESYRWGQRVRGLVVGLGLGDAIGSAHGTVPAKG